MRWGPKIIGTVCLGCFEDAAILNEVELELARLSRELRRTVALIAVIWGALQRAVADRPPGALFAAEEDTRRLALYS